MLFRSPNAGILKVLNNNTIWAQDYSVQKTVLFANGVTIPGDGSTSARVGADGNGLHGGLLTTPILKGRKDLTNLEITFLETNASFVDFVMRPWAVAVAQYGLFTRAPNDPQNFKTTITISYLRKDKSAGDNDDERKIIKFKDVAPIEVQGYETAYGATGKGVDMRTVKTVWTYSTYSIEYPATFTSEVTGQDNN